MGKPRERKPVSEHTPRGVLDTKYNVDRLAKPHLVFRYKVRARMVASYVKQLLPGEAPYGVLDFGSAEGLTLLELSKLISLREACGVEYVEEMFRNSPPKPDCIRLIQGDISELPTSVQANHYDIVSALAVLEHISEPLRAVKEAFRCLRPGGIFVATSPKPSWDALSSNLGFHRKGHHETDMTRRMFVDLVKTAGFDLVAYEPFMFLPVAFLPYLRIPVSPEWSIRIDKRLRQLVLFAPFFINQCLVGQKPK